MIIYKAKKPVLLAVVLWCCSVSCGLFAQNITLADGTVFINEAPLFSAPGLVDSEQVLALAVSAGESIQLQENAHRPGFASFRFSSDQKRLPSTNSSGKLEVFVYAASPLAGVKFDVS